MTGKLVISEFYRSIQGESTYAGIPCTFVRLTGCPLRCRWCDTVYAFQGGREYSQEEVLSEVRSLGIPLVEFTGGEPLAQKAVIPVMKTLIEAGFQLLVETSGSESVAEVPKEVTIIMDVKCPGSGMVDRNLWDNFDHLKPGKDEIKFVIANDEDFDFAADIVRQRGLAKRFVVHFSPAWGLMKPDRLAEKIVAEIPEVRLQIQQHKYIWSPRAKGV